VSLIFVGESMDILKIPIMNKREYDELINEQYISRIAFKGKYPYIAPFMYVFNGKSLYFLSTKYGKKIQLFRKNPKVAIEIEKYADDLSEFRFVTLQGHISEVKDPSEKKDVKKRFVDLIKSKHLSRSIMAALGHSPEEPPESILKEEKSFVWKLVDVENIIGIKNQ
jgi:uncharacterized protein